MIFLVGRRFIYIYIYIYICNYIIVQNAYIDDIFCGFIRLLILMTPCRHTKEAQKRRHG